MASPAFVSAPLATRFPSATRHATSARPIVYRVARPRMGMQVKTEALPKSQVGLEIQVGKEECKAAWDSVLRDLQKRVNVDGFRAGKVPKQVILARFGKERIRASACEEVIEKSIQKALEESGITAIGQAEFNSDGGVDEVIENYSPQSELTFKVKVDVWPQCNFIASYESLKVDAEEVPLDETLVDKAMEELRKKESFSVLSPEGTTADIDKLIVVDMLGYYAKDDGSKGDRMPDIADGTNIEITLEEGKFFEGFVNGIVGAAVGETRSVSIQFPETNPQPELAGKNAIFDVTVNAVKDVVLPELDDDFAKQVSESASLEELRGKIRERLGTETELAREKNVNKAIEDKLANIVEIELPETLLENQVKKNFATMLSGFKDNGMSDSQVKAMVTKENYELYKTRGLDKAVRALKVNFSVSKIAKDLQLVPSTEEIDNQIALVRAELKGQEFDEDKVRDQVESQLERDMVLRKLKETANINFVTLKEAPIVEKEAEVASVSQ